MNINDKRKTLIAFIINILILGLEIVGLILSIRRRGVQAFLFYTEISNYFTLVVSIIFIMHLLVIWKNKSNIARWVQMLRFMSTVSLAITLVVVICVLIPMSPRLWKFLLFEDSNIIHHILCPLLAVVSFVKFEQVNGLNRRATILALIPTIIYGVGMIILNIFKVIVGPYPFFYVYKFPWYVIVLLLSVVLGIAYLIAFTIAAICKRQNRERIKKS